MKTQKIKSLSWVSGLFLLTVFLISPDALAQKNKGHKGNKKHAGYDYDDYYYADSHNDYYYYGNNRSNRNNGSCGNGTPAYRVYDNRGNGRYGNQGYYGNNNRHRNNRVRIGTVVDRLPRNARPIWIRGRKFFAHRGMLWKEFRKPCGTRFFKAIDRLR